MGIRNAYAHPLRFIIARFAAINGQADLGAGRMEELCPCAVQNVGVGGGDLLKQIVLSPCPICMNIHQIKCGAGYLFCPDCKRHYRTEEYIRKNLRELSEAIANGEIVRVQ